LQQHICSFLEATSTHHVAELAGHSQRKHPVNTTGLREGCGA
jgi:hypothetical protein